MARSERLLTLLQALRRHRRPVTGAALAEETGVSLRTLYRDIASLQAQGAHIEGEAGVGYVLKPGFMLPPMMFSQDEIEALVLGSRWVARAAEPRLAAAGADAMAKIAAVLPEEMRDEIDSATLLVGPRRISEDKADLSVIRRAIRMERILELNYTDESGAVSVRRVWPFALGYLEHIRIMAAWCELRGDYRHFRTDRIGDMTVQDGRYPRRRAVLMKEWREIDDYARNA
ncbi:MULTISPECIES: helix-turn-helix transcriptional regulator [unclassified Rhizobium]|uniref:helix-turn-helix transcriptional regulator n=1 Tax=unclassified Rhizobium TaxID=2613769 RepID=UPI001AD9B88E|nr:MULTISPECIES: YafY family protein [unclassified Rhizobium]MBO9096628.1 YafY family transcriptional regulator [Rhizobium sp. L58/93]MBO9136386.1 YafY family transcriptional regulator [Rhizobium sp. B209b/85]MBO9166884.1 YafY family transcriptional regulator [Rhizobium sp. L245/93]MBO9182856.1 YafY family transcriptional regulator [Rhizobium sp. E27B/91]QXZ82662.1 YafY family transcriptional regulator [Rhizobium sp. K1/93]